MCKNLTSTNSIRSNMGVPARPFVALLCSVGSEADLLENKRYCRLRGCFVEKRHLVRDLRKVLHQADMIGEAGGLENDSTECRTE